jgi:hypothetical protein
LEDAQQKMHQIVEERKSRAQIQTNTTIGISWDNSDRNHRLGYLGGELVAEIKQDENHNSENEEVYTVYVRGERRDKRYRHVETARLDLNVEFGY